MEIFEFLKSTILELSDIQEEDIVPQISLEDLALDSLDYVEIQVGIKKKYGVQISPQVLASGKVKTLEDFCNYIASCQMQPAAGSVA